jgi:hypothetical protein
MKEEYLIDLNATQAAIRAGYKVDSARDIGCENLTKPNIAEEIEKALAERSRRTVFGHGYTHKSDYFMDWVAYGWQSAYISIFQGKKTLILCGVASLEFPQYKGVET